MLKPAFTKWVLPCLTLALVCCTPGEAPTDSLAEGPAVGRLVIIGGGLRRETTDVYQAVLDGRDGDGPLCVFPTASAEPEASMNSAIEAFDAVGGEGTAQGIFMTVDDPGVAALPETVSRIEGCSGFYFVGGVQTRIVQVFRPESGDSPAYDALLRRHGSGAVVSGSSAGAAIMTDPMIGGGTSVGALTAGLRSDEDGEGVILEKGMGFWDGAFVDQHFLARGRWARLLVAVLATDGFDYGMGIDENTALVVDGDSVWVAGASGVVFFDTKEVVRDEAGHAGSNISLHLLGTGDGVDLSTGAVQINGTKTQISAGMDTAGEIGEDLFDRWALLRFLDHTAKSPDGSFGFQQDGYSFEFVKDPGFVAFSWDEEGVEGAPRGLSMGPLRMSVLAASAGGS